MRPPPPPLSNPQVYLVPVLSKGAARRISAKRITITTGPPLLSSSPSLPLKLRNLGCTGSPASTRESIIVSARKNKLFTASSTPRLCCCRPFNTSPPSIRSIARNMATATRIQLSTTDSGVFSAGVRADSAQAASEVLQEDMEKHHIFFNEQQFHSESGFRSFLSVLWVVYDNWCMRFSMLKRLVLCQLTVPCIDVVLYNPCRWGFAF